MKSILYTKTYLKPIYNNKVINHGTEDIKSFNLDEITKIINSGENCILYYLDFKHFNNRLLDQQNIIYSNFKSNTCKLYINDNWTTSLLNDVIPNLIKKSIDDIRFFCEEYSTYINNQDKKILLDKYLDDLIFFYDYKDNIDKFVLDQDKEMIKLEMKKLKKIHYDTKDQILMMFYNRKFHPKHKYKFDENTNRMVIVHE